MAYEKIQDLFCIFNSLTLDERNQYLKLLCHMKVIQYDNGNIMLDPTIKAQDIENLFEEIKNKTQDNQQTNEDYINTLIKTAISEQSATITHDIEATVNLSFEEIRKNIKLALEQQSVIIEKSIKSTLEETKEYLTDMNMDMIMRTNENLTKQIQDAKVEITNEICNLKELVNYMKADSAV
ncbi:MAG TPA: hypothetical protein DDW65_21720 [Firmicutes bacterium]|jgi:hypothetical protein|nr:hypothetical protein [Bacillota bacterium]